MIESSDDIPTARGITRQIGVIVVICALLAGGLLVGWKAFRGWGEGAVSVHGEEGQQQQVAVEVAPITSGRIREIRVFAGTLEALARFRAAAKIGGLVQRVHVDLGDEIQRDQVVATIDDAELVQEIVQARGNLAVEKANQAGAESMLELARAQHERVRQLHERGLAAQQRLEETAAALASAEAELHLARGQVKRAAATLELSRIRRGHTEVRASWAGDQQAAVVAERHQEAGNTVQPGDPIVDAVVLDPLVCVMAVPERDYARLSVGQKGTITTDSAPGKELSGEIRRIAPVFRETSRQATIHLHVENPGGALKPGAFARVRLELAAADAAAIVPSAAITRRKDRDVVFVLAPDSTTVSMRHVQTGIAEGDTIQVTPADDKPLLGRVVVLGQQLLDDGSAVRVVSGGDPGE